MDPIVAYKDLTDLIQTGTGLSRPLLHFHGGTAIYLLTLLARRSRGGPTAALLTVAAVELGNEAMNRLYWDSWRWADTIEDVIVTLAGPACLFAAGKVHDWHRSLRARARNQAARGIWSRDRIRIASSI